MSVEIEVTQYCNSPRWIIRYQGERLPDGDKAIEWASFRGTLHQDYDTAEEASAAVRWWGFKPVINPHVHQIC
jgi:hypothetical protein